MRTALDKILKLIDEETDGKIYIEDFSFMYNDYEIVFMGHYWCFVYKLGQAREIAEYTWEDYSQMLNFTFPETNKNMQEMLSERSEIDLKVIHSAC